MKTCWRIARQHRCKVEDGYWSKSTCCLRSQYRNSELFNLWPHLLASVSSTCSLRFHAISEMCSYQPFHNKKRKFSTFKFIFFHFLFITHGTWTLAGRLFQQNTLVSAGFSTQSACMGTPTHKQSKTTSIRWTDSDHVFGSVLFIVPDLCCCSASRLLCSLIDWPPLLGLSN